MAVIKRELGLLVYPVLWACLVGVYRALNTSLGRKMSASKTGKLVNAHAVHRSKTQSLLTSSSETNFNGVVNLGVTIIVANMVRLALENFKKYGLLIRLGWTQSLTADFWCALLTAAALSTNAMLAVGLEKALVHYPRLDNRPLHESIVFINIISLLVVPAWIVWNYIQNPFIGVSVITPPLILTMKIISYHAVNKELRLIKETKSDDLKDPYPECPYPQNITLGNFIYFWLAPTLCYQPIYPRSEGVCLKFIVLRLAEIAISLATIYVFVFQYGFPTLANSMELIDGNDWIGLIERLLKLSTTSLYIWLIFFYVFFHSFLNLTAELLRFGDRRFYQDWWNANSIGDYWRLWNTPVHTWIKRHMYFPLRARGIRGNVAMILVFFVSALMHEYLAAIPMKTFQGWAFLIIFLQAPLTIITDWYCKRRPKSLLGNYLLWISICFFGEPLLVLLYYRSWIMRSTNSPVFFFF